MKMNNRWNQIIYRLWAPIYDSTVNRLFLPGRKRALKLLNLHAGERVLIAGVGTGADLPLLPSGVEVTGIDLSPEMLEKARLKLDRCSASVKLIQGDAQGLLLNAVSFDAAILNLILSVIPDGNACLRSTLRALKPCGRIVIFDKFMPEGKSISFGCWFVNIFSTMLGTDINRKLSDLLRDCSCKVLHEEASIGNGMYRVILLQKDESTSPESSHN